MDFPPGPHPDDSIRGGSYDPWCHDVDPQGGLIRQFTFPLKSRGQALAGRRATARSHRGKRTPTPPLLPGVGRVRDQAKRVAWGPQIHVRCAQNRGWVPADVSMKGLEVRRAPWAIQVAPKPVSWGQTGETPTQRRSHAKMETGTGRMRSPAQGPREPPEAAGGREDPALEIRRECRPGCSHWSHRCPGTCAHPLWTSVSRSQKDRTASRIQP